MFYSKLKHLERSVLKCRGSITISVLNVARKYININNIRRVFIRSPGCLSVKMTMNIIYHLVVSCVDVSDEFYYNLVWHISCR